MINRRYYWLRLFQWIKEKIGCRRKKSCSLLLTLEVISTLGFRLAWQPERGTSVGCKASPANPCSARCFARNDASQCVTTPPLVLSGGYSNTPAPLIACGRFRRESRTLPHGS